MNFTREPIIETIVSAKEGYKLAIKSSKGGREEGYLVDAVEVVSFGGTFFYRSQEKPKAFLLPAADYEILEVKETRLLIKSPSMEKTIKIAGGKESTPSSKGAKASSNGEKKEEEASSSLPVETPPPAGKQEGRREKKKYRKGKRGSSEEAKAAPSEEMKKEEGIPVPPPVFSHLLKPPENLISESLHRYKKTTEDIISVEVSAEIYPDKEFFQAEKEPNLVRDPLFAEESLAAERYVTDGIKGDLESNLISEQPQNLFDEPEGKKETILSVPSPLEEEGYPEIPLE